MKFYELFLFLHFSQIICSGDVASLRQLLTVNGMFFEDGQTSSVPKLKAVSSHCHPLCRCIRCSIRNSSVGNKNQSTSIDGGKECGNDSFAVALFSSCTFRGWTGMRYM